MTSRLKRKLNDLGVDTSSSKATENFCLIGTPLPPLEKSKDAGEFVPLWKQEVRDEKGRRRLHGAFTGGFSAGYFNTVGSKEGWAPSEFRSSRSDRAKKKASRPEDFMDEEDLVELRDGQKLVSSTEEMDLDFWEKRKATGSGEDKDSITSALEEVLLPAPRDSVGAQILKKMGWHMGHGIGPKVTYEQRKRQDVLLHAPGSEGNLPDLEDHEEAKKHLYPPRDTRVPVFKRKDDKHGLGYEPGLGLSDIVTSAKDRSDSKQGPNISAGFGLGALNDADEDDLDVYDGRPSTTSRRLAYDADEVDEQIVIGSRSKSIKPSPQHWRDPPPIASRSTFSNGIRCVSGFVIAEKPVTEENLFPPPIVPKGWTPDPRRVWEQDKENFKAGSTIQGRSQRSAVKDGRPVLSAAERGNLLGEAPLPASPKSIFDYLKPQDRERLKSLAAGVAQPNEPKVEPSQREPGPSLEERASTIPRLDPQVAKMALQGFQPFTNDPVKQARYTAYLQAQAAGEDSVPFTRMPGQHADAFMRELEDYARSAQVFKPMSAMMAGRFTRAAVIDSGPKAAEGLHRPVEEGSSYLTVPSEQEKEEPKKEESPKENAARLGMFGPLTREVKLWVPARLLCKRFGVKEPEVELPSEAATTNTPAAGNRQSGDVLAITNAEEAGLIGSTQIGDSGHTMGNEASKTFTTPGKRDIANIGLGDEDGTQGRDILTYERPGMDIFKAIFASDEEDEGEGEGEDQAGDDDNAGPQLDGNVKSNGDTVGVEGTQTPAAESAPTRPVPVDYNNMAGKIDIAEFKPTFVSRTDRMQDKEKRDKLKDREKKKKKTKKTLVSFEVDEEDADEVRDRERDSEKKKKKKLKKKATTAVPDEDEGMWVEKLLPETVQNFPPTVVASGEGTTGASVIEEETEAGPPRGRKRAIDFM